MSTAAMQGVSFPEAGESVRLSFRNRDMAELQNEFGDDWFMSAVSRCNRFDMKFLLACLRVGGKKDGEPRPITHEDADKVIGSTIASRVLDALFLSQHGMTFEDHLKRVLEEDKKSAKENKSGADSERPQ